MTTNVSDTERPEEPRDAVTAGALPVPDDELPEATVSDQLQDLVLDSSDVGDFLLELCEYSAALASPEGGPMLDCAITLYRRHRALTGAGNTPRARTLNDIQERMGEGPCLTALQEITTVVVADTASDVRWPQYAGALLQENVHSVLAVPLVLDQDAAASINFFAATPDLFHDELVASAQQYAAQAQKALRLAVRIGTKQQKADDLHEAMRSRTVIDLAVGVIMGQQRCSQTAAFAILSRAASSRNHKLRDVAQDLLENLSKQSVKTHFDE